MRVPVVMVMSVGLLSSVAHGFSYECLDKDAPRAKRTLVVPAVHTSMTTPVIEMRAGGLIHIDARLSRLSDVAAGLARARGLSFVVDADVANVPITLIADAIDGSRAVWMLSESDGRGDIYDDPSPYRVVVDDGVLRVRRNQTLCGRSPSAKLVSVPASLQPQALRLASLLGLGASAVSEGVVVDGALFDVADFESLVAGRPGGGDVASCAAFPEVNPMPTIPAVDDDPGTAQVAVVGGAVSNAKAAISAPLDVTFVGARSDTIAAALASALKVDILVEMQAAGERATLSARGLTLVELAKILHESTNLDLSWTTKGNARWFTLSRREAQPVFQSTHVLEPREGWSPATQLAAVCHHRRPGEWATVLGDRVVVHATQERLADFDLHDQAWRRDVDRRAR